MEAACSKLSSRHIRAACVCVFPTRRCIDTHYCEKTLVKLGGMCYAATASRCLACYGCSRDRADSVLKNTRSTSVSDLELCRRGSVKQLGTMKCGSLKERDPFTHCARKDHLICLICKEMNLVLKEPERRGTRSHISKGSRFERITVNQELHFLWQQP